MSTFKDLLMKSLYLLVCLSLLGTIVPPAEATAAPPLLQGAGEPSVVEETLPPTPTPVSQPGDGDAPPDDHFIYLPVIGKGAEGPPSPPPPEGTEVLVKPGIGGIAAAEDGSVRAIFSPKSVEQDTWVRYQPLERPMIITPSLAVGGPAFSLTAWEDVTGTPVTQFPHDVTMVPATEDTPAYGLVSPSIVISVRYTDADVWGLDLRTLSLYARQGPEQDWERLPTAVYQEQKLLVAEADHLSEFAPLGGLAYNSSQDVKRLALDPDDDVGWAIWPGVGEVREITYNMRLARETRQRFADNKCQIDILLTRDSESQTFVSRSTRAQMARDFGAEMFTTLAFNALYGHPWGVESDGGVRGWARNGHPDDDALVNEFFNRIQEYTGRPHTRPVQHPSLYPDFDALPGSMTYGHIETLFMDHDYDWVVISDHFSLIVDAAYAALATRLAEMGLVCGDDGGPPPLPAPPSPELLQRLRDLGRQNYQRYGADPVSFSTGNHVIQVGLFRIPGRGGLDIDFTLAYNSQDGRDDLFGYGWSFPYNARAIHYSDDSVSIALHDGRTYHYTWNASGYDAPAGVYDTLEKIDNGWRWTTPDGTVLTFQETVGGLGILTEWRDRRGNALHFSYDLSGQDNWQNGDPVPRPPLTEIGDDAGRTITFQYGGESHVTGLTTPDGRAFSFAYTDGNLTAITDANGGTRRFQYDARHRITHEWDEEDILYLQSVYDDRDRVIEQIDAKGTHSFLDYDPINRVTTFTDNLGRQEVYNWDEANRVTDEQDGSGAQVVNEYDDDYNLTRRTDANGNTTAYTYDERGNVLTRSDPLDRYSMYASDVTTYAYNATNDLVSTEDALGNVSTYEYDAEGNLVRATEPNGATTTATYNAWGQPTSITDAEGHTTTYEYDSYGDRTKTTDAGGNVSTSTYDAAGRELTFTDANGHAAQFEYDDNDNITAIIDPKGRRTEFRYDGNDNLVWMKDRRGGITTYAYDENLKLIEEKDPEGNVTRYGYDDAYNRIWRRDPRGHETRYEYDEAYNLRRVIDAKGGVTTYDYDGNGNLTRATDALGNVTRMVYDASNRLKFLIDAMGGRTEYCYDAEDRLIRTIGPRGEVTNYEYDSVGNLVKFIDPLANVTAYRYDKVGNRRFVTDARGHTTEYVYDRIDRLVRTIDPLGHQVEMEYDGVGNVTRAVDARGNVTSMAYDENDNLVRITDPLGGAVEYAYDEEDNRASATDQRGHTTTSSYDLNGLLTRIVEPGGEETLFSYDQAGNLVRQRNADGQETSYAYDELDRLVSETDPLGNATTYAYDALGQLIALTDAEGHTTRYTYDALGRLAAVTDALDGVTAYEYDVVGNHTKITDANGRVTHFEYNFLNQLKKEINPLGKAWEYAYDAVGNLTRRVDGRWQMIHYDYDAADQLVRIRYPDGKRVEFTYDENGNELSMADWNGVTTHAYDALDRRTQTASFDGQAISYEYDAASNLAALTYPNGQRVAYEYDAHNRLEKMHDPDSLTASYTYDPLGRLSQVVNPNSTVAEYNYDAAGRLRELTNQRGAGILSAYQYTLDRVGNRTQTVETRQPFDGAGDMQVITHHYSYDALYRLTASATTEPNSAVAYEYDPVGNRLRKSGTALAPDPTNPVLPISTEAVDESYTYNEANQLLTAGDATFTYDDNGNRASKTEDGQTITYLYDCEDRLTNVISPTAVITYTYDGYGRRVRKEVRPDSGDAPTGTLTIEYLYDGLEVIKEVATTGVGASAVSTTTHYYRSRCASCSREMPLVSMERLPNPATGFAGDKYWYHYDGLGSIVHLTDESGNVVDPALYEEYGLLLAGADSRARFAYTGQEYDPETGFYHFYARQYDPETGVWITQDSWRGYIFKSLSLHRYIYVYNNPINYRDANGYWLIWDDVIAIVGGGTEGVASQGASDLIDNIWEHGLDVHSYEWGSWEEYAAAGISSAIGTEISLYASPVIGGAVEGALEPIIRDILIHRHHLDQWCWQNSLRDAIIGAAFGAASGGVGKASPKIRGRIAKGLRYFVSKRAIKQYKDILGDLIEDVVWKKIEKTFVAIADGLLGGDSILKRDLCAQTNNGSNEGEDGIRDEIEESSGSSSPNKRKLIDSPPPGYKPFCNPAGCFA